MITIFLVGIVGLYYLFACYISEVIFCIDIQNLEETVIIHDISTEVKEDEWWKE
jgi:hypothetical protein